MTGGRRGASLLVALAAGCGPAAGRAPAARVAEVKRQDLVLDVEVTGALKSLDSDERRAARAVTDTWDFKIARMAPEGTQVKAGHEVLAFDPSELEKRLRDYESEVAELSEELGKAARRGDRWPRSTTAWSWRRPRPSARKAELKADKPADLTAELSAEDARRSTATWPPGGRVPADREDRRPPAQRAGRPGDAASSRLERARRRVEEIKASIATMSVKARRAGTVVYKQNWRGEKKKVGDGTWRGRDGAWRSPRSTRWRRRARSTRSTPARCAMGQRVGLRLEAHPDVEYAGVVERVATLVGTESPESRVKVVQLEIKLREDRSRC